MRISDLLLAASRHRPKCVIWRPSQPGADCPVQHAGNRTLVTRARGSKFLVRSLEDRGLQLLRLVVEPQTVDNRTNVEICGAAT